jgi:hypothetical protein
LVAITYMNCIQDGRALPPELVIYNRDDVLALRTVVEWLENLPKIS